jgi:SAM-dependent methyltransferase
MREWITFWDSDNSIYVSARHRDVHYRLIAEDILAYVPGPDATVLDYGCGEALSAGVIAAHAKRLILSDASPNARAALKRRAANEPRIEVLAPDEVADLAHASLDLIAMVSVAQYLTPEELDRLLAMFRRLLKPTGRLVLADIVSPSVSPVQDVAALLRLGAANGFFWTAIAGLARTAFSTYSKLRTRIGLTRYEEAAILEKLRAAGFAAARASRNVGHNPTRMTFLATPAFRKSAS